jgi:hypothetical protein
MTHPRLGETKVTDWAVKPVGTGAPVGAEGAAAPAPDAVVVVVGVLAEVVV